ncbi:MAG: hypothetical protein Q4B70_00960 [Lachnospiraceae bacterium]|nr:hypothetical protein [Lachnospiraceae bacterium]
MARPMGEETKRAKTVQSLEKALENNHMSEKFLQDKVDEYMSFYDDLKYINDRLITLKSDENGSLKQYTEAVSEKRRISNEMRNILTFLGLKPEAQLTPGGGSDEEL